MSPLAGVPVVTCTLLADGSSDQVLLPILQWLLDNHCNSITRLRFANPLQTASRGLQERISAALDLYPCHVLFVHRDAERDEPTNRQQEIERAWHIVEREQHLVTVVPVRMTEEELASVRQATRGILQDATCTMSISIERRLIDQAMSTPDTTFEAPPQPVACTVKTAKSDLAITFTFAPRVEFKVGTAVKATPGMAAVKGVSRLLSWPVTLYVNRSKEIEQGMLQVVNAYLKRYGLKATAQR